MTTADTASKFASAFPTQAAFAKTHHAALAEMSAIQSETIRFGESLTAFSPAELNARPGERRWSPLECLEHLNRYADHYLPLLAAKVAAAEPREARRPYRPGLLGKPFALALHPTRRLKRLNCPRKMNPIGSELDAPAVVYAFRQNQQTYLDLLTRLDGMDLHGNRIPISAFPIVRLSLGDMLHTLVWHNARHVLQAEEGL